MGGLDAEPVAKLWASLVHGERWSSATSDRLPTSGEGSYILKIVLASMRIWHMASPSEGSKVGGTSLRTKLPEHLIWLQRTNILNQHRQHLRKRHNQAKRLHLRERHKQPKRLHPREHLCLTRPPLWVDLGRLWLPTRERPPPRPCSQAGPGGLRLHLRERHLFPILWQHLKELPQTPRPRLLACPGGCRTHQQERPPTPFLRLHHWEYLRPLGSRSRTSPGERRLHPQERHP